MNVALVRLRHAGVSGSFAGHKVDSVCCFVKLTDGNSNMTTVYKGSQFNLNSIAFKQDDAQMHVNMEYSFHLP